MTKSIDLDQIRIASPCTASWAKMEGNDQARFCGDCRKNVYDLASMSRQEAVDLIREKEGSVCMRIHRRPDGTVMVGDCPVGWRAVRRRALQGAAGIVAWVTAAMMGVGCGGKKAPPDLPMGAIAVPVDPDGAGSADPDPPEMMGEICVETEPKVVLMGDICIEPIDEPDPQEGDTGEQ